MGTGIIPILQMRKLRDREMRSLPETPDKELVRFGPTALSFREGNGNPLQYSHLENPMDGLA